MLSQEQIQESLSTLEKDPGNINANYIISVYLALKNEYEKLYPFITRVVESKQPIKGALLILGKYYQSYKKDYLKAEELFREEHSKFPESSTCIVNLAELLARTGRTEEALIYFKKLTKLEPKNKEAWDSYLLYSQYSNKASNQDLQTLADLSHQKLWAGLENNDFSHLDLDPKRTSFNVGFVSGDLRRHSVAFFVKNLFELLGREHNVFCYCNNEIDPMTQELMQEGQEWRNILGISTEDVCKQIKEDKIDILIDLSGNTGKNRLDIFARKPAPVQATWLGQSPPFGLKTIEYLFTNKFLLPENEKELFEEKTLYLDNVYTPFTIPLDELEIKNPPCLEKGFVTFGSFTNFIKFNDEVLNTWSEILSKVPNSKLFLRASVFEDMNFKNHILQRFEDNGINSSRIIIEKHTGNKKKYMQDYNQVDICLDTFPIGGNTTTNDILYMGLPLVTLYGKRMSERTSASLLNDLKLQDLITYSKEEYIQKAIELAYDHERLQDLRKNLRNQYLNSPIYDKVAFAKSFSNKLKEAWKDKMEDC